MEVKKIELRKTVKGKKLLYEAVEDGIVIATRTSNNNYVAALCSTKNKKIINGIGRPDLIPNSLSKIGDLTDIRLAIYVSPSTNV